MGRFFGSDAVHKIYVLTFSDKSIDLSELLAIGFDFTDVGFEWSIEICVKIFCVTSVPPVSEHSHKLSHDHSTMYIPRGVDFRASIKSTPRAETIMAQAHL